jgi:hypothetical protein
MVLDGGPKVEGYENAGINRFEVEDERVLQ